MGYEIVFNLRSKIANRNILFKLATLVGRIRKSDFNYEHYGTLSRFIIKNTSDFNI